MPVAPPQVTANHALRRIGLIMANGKKMERSHFPAHTGHMITLDKIYEDERRALEKLPLEDRTQEGTIPSVKKGQNTKLIEYVRAYLIEAHGHVPQAATNEEIPLLIEEMTQLINEYGVQPVALFLRQNAVAPLDRF